MKDTHVMAVSFVSVRISAILGDGLQANPSRHNSHEVSSNQTKANQIDPLVATLQFGLDKWRAEKQRLHINRCCLH